MIISVVYLLVCCLLGCLTVLTRHQMSKDAELPVLRHENAVLAGSDQRAAEADPGLDGAGMIGPEQAGAAGQDPFKPQNGLRRLSGRQQCVGQQVGRQNGVRMAWPEDPVAVGGEIPPPVDRRTGQAGAVQTLPGRQQQPVTAAP